VNGKGGCSCTSDRRRRSISVIITICLLQHCTLGNCLLAILLAGNSSTQFFLLLLSQVVVVEVDEDEIGEELASSQSSLKPFTILLLTTGWARSHTLFIMDNDEMRMRWKQNKRLVVVVVMVNERKSFLYA